MSTTISRSALLPYAASRVFDLVNDIESYPQYMKGCDNAVILERGADFVEARLDLRRGGIVQSFTTRNWLIGKERIELELVQGPFREFRGQWRFRALSDDACKVSLDLEFTPSNALLGIVAARLFDRAANDLVDSLASRAEQTLGQEQSNEH